jgi:hypothetical protein
MREARHIVLVKKRTAHRIVVGKYENTYEKERPICEHRCR